jgi:hypothetical protein
MPNNAIINPSFPLNSSLQKPVRVAVVGTGNVGSTFRLHTVAERSRFGDRAHRRQQGAR